MTPAIAEPKSPEQIVAAAQAAREESLEAYYTLARRVATGEDVDPAEVSRIATLAGKPLEENPGEFTALIAAFQHRHRLRAKVARLAPCEKEMTEARAAIDKANADLEVAVQHHQRVTAPLQTRLRELRQEYGDASSTSSDLIANCPIPGLRRASKAIHRERELVGLHRLKLADDAGAIRRQLARKGEVVETPERVELDRRASAIEAEVAALDAQLVELDRRGSENTKAMIDT